MARPELARDISRITPEFVLDYQLGATLLQKPEAVFDRLADFQYAELDGWRNAVSRNGWLSSHYIPWIIEQWKLIDGEIEPVKLSVSIGSRQLHRQKDLRQGTVLSEEQMDETVQVSLNHIVPYAPRDRLQVVFTADKATRNLLGIEAVLGTASTENSKTTRIREIKKMKLNISEGVLNLEIDPDLESSDYWSSDHRSDRYGYADILGNPDLALDKIIEYKRLKDGVKTRWMQEHFAPWIIRQWILVDETIKQVDFYNRPDGEVTREVTLGRGKRLKEMKASEAGLTEVALIFDPKYGDGVTLDLLTVSFKVDSGTRVLRQLSMRLYESREDGIGRVFRGADYDVTDGTLMLTSPWK